MLFINHIYFKIYKPSKLWTRPQTAKVEKSIQEISNSPGEMI